MYVQMYVIKIECKYNVFDLFEYGNNNNDNNIILILILIPTFTTYTFFLWVEQ